MHVYTYSKILLIPSLIAQPTWLFVVLAIYYLVSQDSLVFPWMVDEWTHGGKGFLPLPTHTASRAEQILWISVPQLPELERRTTSTNPASIITNLKLKKILCEVEGQWANWHKNQWRQWTPKGTIVLWLLLKAEATGPFPLDVMPLWREVQH